MSGYLRDLQAAGRPATTQRSYSFVPLRWFRFCWAVGVPWDQATRAEAWDFCRHLQLAARPALPQDAAGAAGKYAPSTAAHCETVCRSFYAYHLEAGTGPIVNLFPLARPGRAHAHHNPMDPFPGQKSGLFRPRVPQRVPRQIPDAVFNELFAGLGSNRDRALVAFWVSTGARAPELLTATCSGADPGQQLITVIRKGSRAIQQLPASPDAFVWPRLYQQEMHGLAPAGPDDPLWGTLRRPFGPLGYHAARAMFDRANAAVGAGWTLHSLRHTAAYRLARDPGMPITDVQWILGHASLTTSPPCWPSPGGCRSPTSATRSARTRRRCRRPRSRRHPRPDPRHQHQRRRHPAAPVLRRPGRLRRRRQPPTPTTQRPETSRSPMTAVRP